MTRLGNTELIDPDALRPYISLLFLECTSNRADLTFSKLADFIKNARKSRARSTCTALESGFDNISAFLRSDPESFGIDQIDGFTYKLESNPSWAMPGSAYVDTHHVLSVALRRGRIFAVYCEPSLRDTIARWLKREPRPPLTRVSQNILQGAFLRGEAKGLWLHGTHVRSATRPDTKHITGRRVQDALSPLEDSSFAMSAARSRLPQDVPRTALLGIIGTVPRKGVVWNRQPQDFNEFLTASIEALQLIEETIASGTPLDRPFPILAVESHDLLEVHGAYDILTVTPDDLPTSTDVTDEMIEAAEVLQSATLKVIGSPASADFKLEVGLDGSTGGVLQATVRMSGDDVVFNFGYYHGTEPTNPGPVRRILNALENDDLFAVYYDSGHVVGPHGIGRRNINPAPFENWHFLDFSGFDITAEKPGKTPSEIHSNIGVGNDRSLFGWVARHYSSGWLVCDDGPGEVADFVHISPDGALSIIHVKAAHSASSLRGISVSAFEVVAGQAAKNSRYLIDLDSLSETLMIPHTPERAAWIDGKRVPNRTEFLTMIGGLMPSDKKRVVIVQPHVSEETYKRIRAGDASDTISRTRDLFRLNSLETLLHTTRGAVVALSAELQVIGSKQ
jgi:hypothetical protein